MATKGKIENNNKRERLITKLAEKRKTLKAVLMNVNSSDEERDDARVALQKLPRNSSKTRYRNRCSLSGRPRAFYRRLGISRVAVRELAHRGEIPGMKKASW